jgi:hypothetical protein
MATGAIFLFENNEYAFIDIEALGNFEIIECGVSFGDEDMGLVNEWVVKKFVYNSIVYCISIDRVKSSELGRNISAGYVQFEQIVGRTDYPHLSQAGDVNFRRAAGFIFPLFNYETSLGNSLLRFVVPQFKSIHFNVSQNFYAVCDVYHTIDVLLNENIFESLPSSADTRTKLKLLKSLELYSSIVPVDIFLPRGNYLVSSDFMCVEIRELRKYLIDTIGLSLGQSGSHPLYLKEGTLLSIDSTDAFPDSILNLALWVMNAPKLIWLGFLEKRLFNYLDTHETSVFTDWFQDTYNYCEIMPTYLDSLRQEFLTYSEGFYSDNQILLSNDYPLKVEETMLENIYFVSGYCGVIERMSVYTLRLLSADIRIKVLRNIASLSLISFNKESSYYHSSEFSVIKIIRSFASNGNIIDNTLLLDALAQTFKLNQRETHTIDHIRLENNAEDIYSKYCLYRILFEGLDDTGRGSANFSDFHALLLEIWERSEYNPYNSIYYQDSASTNTNLNELAINQTLNSHLNKWKDLGYEYSFEFFLANGEKSYGSNENRPMAFEFSSERSVNTLGFFIENIDFEFSNDGSGIKWRKYTWGPYGGFYKPYYGSYSAEYHIFQPIQVVNFSGDMAVQLPISKDSANGLDISSWQYQGYFPICFLKYAETKNTTSNIALAGVLVSNIILSLSIIGQIGRLGFLALGFETGIQAGGSAAFFVLRAASLTVTIPTTALSLWYSHFDNTCAQGNLYDEDPKCMKLLELLLKLQMASSIAGDLAFLKISRVVKELDEIDPNNLLGLPNREYLLQFRDHSIIIESFRNEVTAAGEQLGQELNDLLNLFDQPNSTLVSAEMKASFALDFVNSSKVVLKRINDDTVLAKFWSEIIDLKLSRRNYLYLEGYKMVDQQFGSVISPEILSSEFSEISSMFTNAQRVKEEIAYCITDAGLSKNPQPGIFYGRTTRGDIFQFIAKENATTGLLNITQFKLVGNEVVNQLISSLGLANFRILESYVNSRPDMVLRIPPTAKQGKFTPYSGGEAAWQLYIYLCKEIKSFGKGKKVALVKEVNIDVGRVDTNPLYIIFEGESQNSGLVLWQTHPSFMAPIRPYTVDRFSVAFKWKGSPYKLGHEPMNMSFQGSDKILKLAVSGVEREVVISLKSLGNDSKDFKALDLKFAQEFGMTMPKGRLIGGKKYTWHHSKREASALADPPYGTMEFELVEFEYHSGAKKVGNNHSLTAITDRQKGADENGVVEFSKQ